MKSIFRLLLVLVCSIIATAPIYAQGRPKKKVAVYMTGNNSNAAYKKVIGSKLVTSITESGEYAAVERTADFLAALAAENDYQTSGEVQDSQIARLGQRFGVKYVVVADASEIFDEYFIAARLINVETGLVEKAYDVSGPAESMAELVTLSQNVAKGLLGERVGNITNGVISATPVHMSLCAIKDGKVQYLTPQQWQELPELDKITYNKKGVCLIDNGNIFIVSMNDVTGGVKMARQLHAPNLSQLRSMYNNLNSLNTALTLFGGMPINTSQTISNGEAGYVSSEYSTDPAKSYKLFMCDGKIEESGWFDNHPANIVRTVYNLNEIQ